MSLIDVNNAKQIRPPMQISCGIAARPNIPLTISNVSGFPIGDTNPSTSLDSEEWPIKSIADLQGDGFPVDGSCEFYTAGAGSEDGKLGLMTAIGGSGTLTVSSSSEIPALTIYTVGEGTITCAGANYEARGVNVIPVNSTSATLTFTSTNAERRMEVQTIIPGVNLQWSQDDIVSVELYLRSDLSIENSQWAVSEIEIQAYYEDDISEAVSTIADNVPIWYTSGYTGDMAPDRRFYLSEPVTIKDHIVTIRGRDASGQLGQTNLAAQILNTTNGAGRRDLYIKLMHIIQDAGVALRSIESAPSKTAGTTERSLIFKESTADTIIQDVMNLAHTGTYWPVFVDAGIPKLSHSKPTAKWDIYEEDCGDVRRKVARNVARIASRDENGLHSRIERSSNADEIARRKVTANTRYSQNAGGGFYWKLGVTNAKDISVTAESIWWTAVENSWWEKINDDGSQEISVGPPEDMKGVTWHKESVVSGKPAKIVKLTGSIYPTPRRAGMTLIMSPIAYGQVYADSVFLYPNYVYLFNRSSTTGQFKWKGDPRMQPRDVFNFHRLDGSVETCTIETIKLKHSGGGTVAEIAYRLGVC